MDHEKAYEKDYRELYEKITNSDWFKKAYHNKSLGECPIVVEELEESRDEKIRKAIIHHILYETKLDAATEHSWVAYLEKQKINTEGDFARGYDCGYECCLNSHGAEWFEKQKEQKPAEWSEEDAEILNDIVVFVSGYADKRVVSKWVEFLKSLYLQPKQEVPKDAETLIAKLVNLLKSYHIGEETATTLANRIADTYGAQRYLDGVCDASKQEWSEEDETRLKVIEEEMERYIMFKQYGTPLSVDDIEWLKSLPERFNLPPKQEWNEEDEKQEEQKPKVWKPSKEQMEALYNIEFKEFKKFGPIIESLYNDLKKL